MNTLLVTLARSIQAFSLTIVFLALFLLSAVVVLGVFEVIAKLVWAI